MSKIVVLRRDGGDNEAYARVFKTLAQDEVVCQDERECLLYWRFTMSDANAVLVALSDIALMIVSEERWEELVERHPASTGHRVMDHRIEGVIDKNTYNVWRVNAERGIKR